MSDQMNIRHKCASQGCWVEQHAIPFGEFDDCFPGNIKMSDVDGIVEMCGGYFLLVEWKTVKSVTQGQEILLKNFSVNSPKQISVVIYGGPGWVSAIRYWSQGKDSDWRDLDMEGLKQFFCNWSARSQKLSKPTPHQKVY